MRSLTVVVVEERWHMVDGEHVSTVAGQQARLADVAVSYHDTLDRPTHFILICDVYTPYQYQTNRICSVSRLFAVSVSHTTIDHIR